uniref:Amino acid transporter transmembrane domain-containing protein n=1 Tax=Timema cristinae TaxID=61476 RepID=A0A7R9CBR4_TIMCR|nr:unnamed protein product [Timema cristinae]
MQPRNRYLGYASRLQERRPGFRHGGNRSGRFSLHALYPHTRKDIILTFYTQPQNEIHFVHPVMPLENSMKNPGHFLGCPGVLNAGMFVVVTLYAIIGFFGYLKYGESTNASVTLNLPSEHVMAQVVKIFIAAAILLTYGLQYFIATDITWPMLEKRVDKRWSSTLQNVYRILTVAITVCVAIAVPNLGPIISLVGAVCYSTLGLLCPVVIDLVTNWEGGLGTWYWVLWKDSFILLFWLAALLTGTYTSVLDIITIDAGAVAHMLKGSIGTGILAMPNAFMNAGLVVGAVGTVVVGFICFHCVHILVKGNGINVRFYILMLLPFLCALGLIRNLRYLVPFSTLANLFIVGGFAITLYYLFTDIPSPDERNYSGSPEGLPIFFSTVIFAMEGIGVVMPLENSMKNPGHFLGCPGVLNVTMTVVVLLFGVMGFVGYLKFGENTRASITLNLPTENILAQTAKLLISASILLTFGLQFFVPTDISWPMIEKHVCEKWKNILQNVYRISMVTAIVLLATAVPNLGPIMSLVGSVVYSIIGLLCPAVIETATCWESGLGRWNWLLWKNLLHHPVRLGRLGHRDLHQRGGHHQGILNEHFSEK